MTEIIWLLVLVTGAACAVRIACRNEEVYNRRMDVLTWGDGLGLDHWIDAGREFRIYDSMASPERMCLSCWRSVDSFLPAEFLEWERAQQP